MRFVILLSFVWCVLFVEGKSFQDPSELDPSELVKKHDEAISKHRQLLANGFGGMVTPLDPLKVGTFTVIDNNRGVQITDTITEATFTGLITFDQIHSNLNQNGSFSSEVHIPSIIFTGNLHMASSILNVPDVTFSATLNDIKFTISGDLYEGDNNVYTVNNTSFQLLIEGSTTNIEIKGENIFKKDIDILNPLIAVRAGPLLIQASETYQSEISDFLTNYINTIEANRHYNN